MPDSVVRLLRNKWAGFSSNLCFDNWPFILLQRVFNRRLNLLTFKKKDLTFIVDYSADDHNGIRYCLSSGMYSDYFGNIASSNPIRFLDLGANVGGFALSLVDAGFTIASGVSVEMNPATYNRLRFNIEYNELSAIQPINAAAYVTNDTLTIEGVKGNTGQSLYGAVTSNPVTIPSFTIDHLVATHFPSDGALDIIKIDIEGAEHEILYSDTCQSLSRFQHLLIEIHPKDQHSTAKLIAALEGKGFINATLPDAPDKDVYYFRR